MDEWEFKGKNVIVHPKGLAIILKEGTWKEPMSLDYNLDKNSDLGIAETGVIMGRGLAFAANNFSSSASTNRPKIKASVKREPGKRTLKLKRD